MKKKKLILAIAACVLVCALSFGVTYSYLIAKAEATGKLYVGENQIKLTEDFEPPAELAPGISFKKAPTVENSGNIPCFVRARADFSTSLASDLCEPLDIDTENWQFNEEDGYYYYKNILEPNEKTSPLFTTVSLKSEIDGVKLTTDDMLDFDIYIYTESIQHTDHDGECEANEFITAWSNYNK